MPSAWDLIPEEEEKELHRIRLLSVEERPFKRITKRLTRVNQIFQDRVQNHVTPPPDVPGTGPRPSAQEKNANHQREMAQLKEEINMDFAAFDSSITRIQFLMDANQRERERYAGDKIRIIQEAQMVRDKTADLRVQLDQAKAALAQRRKFDELADRIKRSKMLKPRDEQHKNLRNLEEECRKLERESGSYAATWKDRREQFDKIIEEGMQLRRLIRDEKDDFDRREGMEEGEEEGETATQCGQTPRPVSQGNASPNPELIVTHSQSRGGETPRPYSSGGRSIRAPTPPLERPEGLKPLPSTLGGSSRTRTTPQAPLRELSLTRPADDGEIEEGENVDMDGSNGQTHSKMQSPEADEKMDTT